MTKKTIIFDTDDESKGHYPSDEAYAPSEIGKVYNVTEDVTNKNIVLSPVDASSDLPTVKIGQLSMQIDTKNTRLGGPLLTGTTIVDASNPSNPVTSLVALMTDGDIWGPAWGGSPTQPGTLSNYIKTSIGATAQGDLGSGWTRLQNGLLLQWGTLSSAKNSVATVTFPTAFTKPCFFTSRLTGGTPIGSELETYFTTNFSSWEDADFRTRATFHCYRIANGGALYELTSWTAMWFAIGY